MSSSAQSRKPGLISSLSRPTSQAPRFLLSQNPGETRTGISKGKYSVSTGVGGGDNHNLEPTLCQHSNRQRDQGTERSPETHSEISEDLVYDKDGIRRQ